MILDHLALARTYAAQADPMLAALALANATIALAEQAQLANRIALAQFENADGSRVPYAGDAPTAIFDHGTEWTVHLKPEIRKMLDV